MDIDSERIKYDAAYRAPQYRVKCHGLKAWADYRTLFPADIRTAIDIGTGTGRLVASWVGSGIDGEGVDFVASVSVDPAIYEAHRERFHESALSDFQPGKVYDFGMCADVMEHIPEEQIDVVLGRIAACCRLVFFQIANFRSVFLGHDLHPSQHRADWWHERITRVMGGTLQDVERRGDMRGEKHVWLWRA